MDSPFIEAAGELAPPENLASPKARDLVERLGGGEIPHAELVECRRLGSEETVVFDLRLEVPNRRAFPIRRLERIAASFTEADRTVPMVEVLRDDFPRVPHLNLNQQEVPPSLCLYDEPYREVKRRWTSARFVRRVREWLELAARGELHPDDQGLEPLLVDFAGHIVLPDDIHREGAERLVVEGIAPEGRRWFLRVWRREEGEPEGGPAIVLSPHTCQPRTHGAVRRAPHTLHDLAEMVREAGLDLIGELRERLPTWREKAIKSRVVLIVSFPKTRTDGGPTEDSETWCFAIAQTVGELSVALGSWSAVDGAAGMLLEPDESKRGQDVPVLVLNPCRDLTREGAARLNGLPGAQDVRVVGVGTGALGSQVVMNLARSGFGCWTLIDHDRLMPHNLARHALPGFVGWNKAEAVAQLAEGITVGEDSFSGLDSELQENGEEIREAVAAADVIVDMTASVAVQRHVARNLDSPARRVCAFLTPSGSDMVILAEDSQRQATLDALEMQYYRALLHDDALADHLHSDGDRQRYGRSCGDTTSAMPQDLVALHSAIASRKLKEVVADAAPFVGVWRAGTDSAVQYVPVEVRRVTEFKVGDWTIVLDDGFRDRLAHLRTEKLPNETGGVLLGSFDLERRILYIVDTLPSPPDSEERRDLYIRGCEGLSGQVEGVEERTGGMLEYIGEWHSHPRGASTMPSGFDLDAFAWLTRLMSIDGLPAVMMIVGEAPEPSLFVGVMGKEEAPIPSAAR